MPVAVRALALPDEPALVKAMGRGDLEARVREYARTEAVAPADVQAEVGSIEEVWKHFDAQTRTAAQAGDQELARSAEDIRQALETDRERLRVADAARREWAEATAGIAEAAEQARAELDRRGLDRWDEAITDMQTGTEREVHTDELAAEAEPGLAAIDSATVDADLACVEAGAAALAEKRAHDQAERDHAAVNEPVIRTSTQALFEIAAQAETEQDADIEI